MAESSKKATIILLKNGGKVREEIKCLFNPDQYTISRSAKWEVTKQKGKDQPGLEFKGGDSAEMTLKLLFDTTLTGAKDVREYTKSLWEAVCVDKGTTKPGTGGKAEPARVMFTWGNTWSFEAVVTNISQDFILFNDEGVPLRSNVTLKLKQSVDDRTFGKQNPTSGGISGNIYVVRDGDRLDLIANEYYQKPMLWRYIAEHNDIDNPRELSAGQRLIIPDLP